MRVASNADFIADASAVTVVLQCRHCSARMLRTSAAAAKDAMADHLLAGHPRSSRPAQVPPW